jgi:hypothetical protein
LDSIEVNQRLGDWTSVVSGLDRHVGTSSGIDSLQGIGFSKIMESTLETMSTEVE